MNMDSERYREGPKRQRPEGLGLSPGTVAPRGSDCDDKNNITK